FTGRNCEDPWKKCRRLKHALTSHCHCLDVRISRGRLGPVNVLVSRGLEQVKPLRFCPALAGDLRTGSRSDSGPPSSPESASSTVSTLRGSPGTLASTPTRRWDTVCGCG